MNYARIDLSKTDYEVLDNSSLIKNPDPKVLEDIYRSYCVYKKFKSVMPIFTSEYFDSNNDVIGYYDKNKLVAFSLIRKYDDENVEAIQFAWNYYNPDMYLGIESLKSECAFYKQLGYKYFYLGFADEYKKQIKGFEILGKLNE